MSIRQLRGRNQNPPDKSIVFGGPKNFDTTPYLDAEGYNLNRIELFEGWDSDGGYIYAERFAYVARRYCYATPDGEEIAFLVYLPEPNPPRLDPATICALALACGALNLANVSYKGWRMDGYPVKMGERNTPLRLYEGR